MSLSDGYYTDMDKSSVSDRDLAAALAGVEPSDANSEVIAEFVSGLRAEVEMMGLPQDSEAQILAATAAVPDVVPQAVPSPVSPTPPE